MSGTSFGDLGFRDAGFEYDFLASGIGAFAALMGAVKDAREYTKYRSELR